MLLCGGTSSSFVQPSLGEERSVLCASFFLRAAPAVQADRHIAEAEQRTPVTRRPCLLNSVFSHKGRLTFFRPGIEPEQNEADIGDQSDLVLDHADARSMPRRRPPGVTPFTAWETRFERQ